MIDLQFVFTIFFLTLGPIKSIPAFHVLTREAAPGDVRALAVRSVLIATVISVAIALIMRAVLESWRVSPDAMRIAGCILLFFSALQMIGSFGQPAGPPKPAITDPKVLRGLALTPLAIPVIITPWGVAAILMFMSIARDDAAGAQWVLAILLGVMVLNLIGMLFARAICRLVGVTSFQILGWIFAVMQAGLATEGIIISLRNLGLIPTSTN
jgi:multiple antibiotic resistance protein